MEAVTTDWTGEFCEAVDAKTKEKIAEVLKELVLPADGVTKIMEVFTSQMDLANSADETKRAQSDLLMENTHVRLLMDGAENGEYLGLDLGGTNFRVVMIKLTDGVADTVVDNYTIPSDVLYSPVKQVFDFIADRIWDFFEKYELGDRKEALPLGFTFSFPSKQLVLNSSQLVTWTKSFKCPDGIGSDPVKLLEEALDRRGLGKKVDVVAVMSDTTSTLLAGNYLDKQVLDPMQHLWNTWTILRGGLAMPKTPSRWWSTWSGVLQGTTAVWTSTAHSMKKMWTTAPTTLDPSHSCPPHWSSPGH